MIASKICTGKETTIDREKLPLVLHHQEDRPPQKKESPRIILRVFQGLNPIHNQFLPIENPIFRRILLENQALL